MLTYEQLSWCKSRRTLRCSQTTVNTLKLDMTKKGAEILGHLFSRPILWYEPFCGGRYLCSKWLGPTTSTFRKVRFCWQHITPVCKFNCCFTNWWRKSEYKWRNNVFLRNIHQSQCINHFYTTYIQWAVFMQNEFLTQNNHRPNEKPLFNKGTSQIVTST